MRLECPFEVNRWVIKSIPRALPRANDSYEEIEETPRVKTGREGERDEWR